MIDESTEKARQPRNLGRSVLALVAGFVVNVVLSLGTDMAMVAMGILPALGRGVMNDSQSLLAAGYRTLFAVISSYVVARLAPYGPVGHAMTGGAIGMVLATVGAIATWNQGLGPHWYPVSLAVTALPSAWLGGMLGARSLTGRAPGER